MEALRWKKSYQIQIRVGSYQSKLVLKLLRMNQQEQTEEIHLVFQGLGLLGSIFISNAAAANNIQILQRHRISAVVTAGRGLLLPHSKQLLSNYLYLPVDDTQDQNISLYFEQVFTFIDKNRKRGNVLVHCYMGISRSAAFIVSYLIKRYGYSMSQAITLLRRKKPKINPNLSFLKQLHRYHQQNLALLEQKEGEYKQLKESLVGSLNQITQKKEAIDEKIRQAHESINNRSREKRSKSEYLKKRLQECLTDTKGRRNSIYGTAKKQSALNVDLLAKKLAGV